MVWELRQRITNGSSWSLFRLGPRVSGRQLVLLRRLPDSEPQLQPPVVQEQRHRIPFRPAPRSVSRTVKGGKAGTAKSERGTSGWYRSADILSALRELKPGDERTQTKERYVSQCANPKPVADRRSANEKRVTTAERRHVVGLRRKKICDCQHARDNENESQCNLQRSASF